MPMLKTRVIHADAVVTGDADVLRDGAIVVDESGAILDVGRASDVLPAHAGLAPERVRGVVFPGLVNAHTHVELSAMRGLVTGGVGFVPWIERLVGVRVEARPEEDDAAIERAASDLHAFGTSAVGEVSNSLVAVCALARHGLGGVVFDEVLGVKREESLARLESLDEARAARMGEWPSDDLAYAPAPHTLYTTHPDVARRAFEVARDRGVRSSLHLAEHAPERRAIEAGEGPVAEWFARMKLDRAWPKRPLFDVAADLGALFPNVLLVHLTDARPEELERVAKSGAQVVLCPRSNLYIETKLPPLLAVRAAGIEAALGTDSLASNASLDVLAEARALADRFSTVRAEELLRMATWNGARALGRPDLGRIARGARPGVVAVLGEVGDDPCGFLLRSLRAPRQWLVARTAGRQIPGSSGGWSTPVGGRT